MNIRPFEIALIGVFAIAAVFGLLYISLYKGNTTDEQRPYGERVVIWGDLDARTMTAYIQKLKESDQELKVVSYREIDSRSFESDLLNAIAEGKSPDLVILPHSLLVKYRTKLQYIKTADLEVRGFRDTYIDGAEIVLLSDGQYGFPFAVDPLVMYWNRDIFSASGIAQPPRTWETLVSETTKAIVRTDDERNLTQSAVAFGEYANVNHAKEILSLLLFQAGSPIVTEGANGYEVVLNKPVDGGLKPLDAVLSFYTQFVVPTKDTYSWNRSKELDRTEFLNGKLALYFGPGSEYSGLLRDNPNLNIDIARVPQGSGVTAERNYGEFYLFAIPRGSQNSGGAAAVARLFGNAQNATLLADAFGFAPVHRASYTGGEQDAFKSVIKQSALIARGWLDPEPDESARILETMVEKVTSGRDRVSNIVNDVVYQLNSLF